MHGAQFFFVTIVLSISADLGEARSSLRRPSVKRRVDFTRRLLAPAEEESREEEHEDDALANGMPAISEEEESALSRDAAPVLPVMTESDFAPEVEMFGNVHFLVHEPTAAYWQHGQQVTRAAANTTAESGQSSSVGIVLMLHACAHHSTDYFGLLPEESAMTREALRRGLTVLVPDAYPMLGRCWNPNTDGPLLSVAIPEVLKKWGLDSKPLYGVGISSGGVMLDVLVSKYGFLFTGLQYQVSPGGAYNGGPGLFATHPHPRSVFVYMQKDLFAPPNTIKAAAEALRAQGTPVRVWLAAPKPIAALLQRSELIGVSRLTAQKMVTKLYNLGYLESRCPKCVPGLVVKGHRMWLEFYRSDQATANFLADKRFKPYLTKTSRQPRALVEEIHVIEGAHGPTAEHFARSLDFMQGVPGV